VIAGSTHTSIQTECPKYESRAPGNRSWKWPLQWEAPTSGDGASGMRSSATTSTSAPRGTLSWMVAATPSAGVPKRSPLRWTSCTPAGQSRAPLFLMRQILSSWAPGATCSPSGTVTSSKNWELKSIRGSWLEGGMRWRSEGQEASIE